MKKAIAAALLLSPLLAHAWQFEGGVGGNLYQTENGRWYQNGTQDNSVQRTSPTLSFGITGPLVSRGNWGVDYHVDYTWFGRAAASCQCDVRDDDYRQRVSGAATARFSGSGYMHGVSATVEPYYYWSGNRLGVELGVAAVQSTWNESVTGWTNGEGSPPQNLALSTSHAIKPAAVVGASISRGPWTIAYQHWFLINQASYQSVPLWKGADLIKVTYRF